MKRRIPRDYLLAFARDCLKLEQLLSEPDDLAELNKFLNLIRSMEKSGGIAALETLLRPEPAGSAGIFAAWNSAIASAAKEAVPPVQVPQAPPTKKTP